jgi:hypothetical protein
MAEQKTIKRDPFKRGDTVVFVYEFTEPYDGFDWSTVTIDCSLTAVAAPTDNTGAAAVRTGETLDVDTDNTASYSFQLTEEESASLVPGTKYKDECQLRQSGDYLVTPITGETLVKQDYVI